MIFISYIVHDLLVAGNRSIFLWLADTVQGYMHHIIDKVNAGSYKHVLKRNIEGAIPIRASLFLLNKNIFLFIKNRIFLQNKIWSL